MAKKKTADEQIVEAFQNSTPTSTEGLTVADLQNAVETLEGEPILPRCLVHITSVGGRAFGQLSDGTWGLIRVDESRDPVRLRFCPAVVEGVE